MFNETEAGLVARLFGCQAGQICGFSCLRREFVCGQSFEQVSLHPQDLSFVASSPIRNTRDVGLSFGDTL